MTGTIQGGVALTLTDINEPLALTYTDAQTIHIACYTHAVYISYSAGGLQSLYSRFKLQKVNDASAEGPEGLTLTFNTPSSGTLYFASANAGANAEVALWAVSCGSKGGLY